MTKEKEYKNFVFRCEWKDYIKDLSDESRLKIYEAIIDYANTGAIPSLESLEKLAFDFMRYQIDDDKLDY